MNETQKIISRWDEPAEHLKKTKEQLCSDYVKFQLLMGGVPKSFWYSKLKGLPESLNHFKKSISDFVSLSPTGQNVVLIGEPGSGKTQTAVIAAKGLLKRSYGNGKKLTLRMLDNNDFICSVKNAEDIDKNLIYASILIIDDFMNRASEAAIYQYFTLLKKRIDAGRRTIITSNLDIFNINKNDVNMKAIQDRLRLAFIYDCNWPSLRGRTDA
jgi:DNA replication protein DnaC